MVRFKVNPFAKESYVDLNDIVVVSPFDIAAMMQKCAVLWDSLGAYEKECLRESTEGIIINALEELAELEEM